MRTDRYLKVVLTVIALELAWLGLRDLAPRVSAQVEPARVILAGVELSLERDVIPVAIAGQTAAAGRAPLRPLQVGIAGQVTLDGRVPIKVEADRPLKIEADRPLKVESVRYTPGDRPGD
jgi:hypothetical protein